MLQFLPRTIGGKKHAFKSNLQFKVNLYILTDPSENVYLVSLAISFALLLWYVQWTFYDLENSGFYFPKGLFIDLMVI